LGWRSCRHVSRPGSRATGPLPHQYRLQRPRGSAAYRHDPVAVKQAPELLVAHERQIGLGHGLGGDITGLVELPGVHERHDAYPETLGLQTLLGGKHHNSTMSPATANTTRPRRPSAPS